VKLSLGLRARRGYVISYLDEPLPRSTQELASEYAARWVAAKGDDTERELLRTEALSFSDDMRAAVKAALQVAA
jgi:hypothetical protein